MSANLTLRMCRRDEHVELRIDGTRVVESAVGRTKRRPFEGRFQKAHVAEIVFEHRLTRLHAEGFTRETGPRPDQATRALPDAFEAARVLAAALERRGDPNGTLLAAQVERLYRDDDDARELERMVLESTPRTPIGPLPRLDEPFLCLEDGHGGLAGWCFDEDDVTIEDALRPELSRIGADSLGFSSDDRSVSLGVVGLHRLRRLLESGARDSLRSLRLMTFGKLEPFLRLLEEHGKASLVSSLVPRGSVISIGDRLPGLQGLGVAERFLPLLLSAPASSLSRLVIFRGEDDLRGALGQLDPAKLPALKHLGLWYRPTRRDDLKALAKHPLLGQLRTLEIWSADDARRMPFDEIFALRPAFSHLERIFLGGHLVPPDVAGRLASWPAVELVDHDRRQALGLDVVTFGWASAMR